MTCFDGCRHAAVTVNVDELESIGRVIVLRDNSVQTDGLSHCQLDCQVIIITKAKVIILLLGREDDDHAQTLTT